MNKKEMYHNSSEFIRLPVEIVYKQEDDSSITKMFLAKLDTGATRTCIPASAISDDLTEEMLIQQGCGKHNLTGIDGEPVRYYKVQMDKLTVYGMDFGSFPIYVTFEQRANKLLIGMDILKFMDINICNSKNKIELSQTDRFLQLKKVYGGRITNPEQLDADIDDEENCKIIHEDDLHMTANTNIIQPYFETLDERIARIRTENRDSQNDDRKSAVVSKSGKNNNNPDGR